MKVAGLVARGRREHLRLLIDKCVVSIRTGEALNEDTGILEPVTAKIWSGPCRVKLIDAQLAQTDAGQQEGTRVRPLLEIPGNVTAAIRKGCRADVSSASPGVDAATYTVIGERSGTTSTVRRFEVEAIERG